MRNVLTTLTMLLLQTEKPTWGPPQSWVTIICLVLTWIGGIITVLKFRYDMEKVRKERERDLNDMALRACREFTNSKEYREAKDQRIREISEDVVEQAFVKRASSFVSSDRFDERMRATEQRLSNMETAIKENTEKIGEMGGKITQQLMSFLANGGRPGRSS